MRPSSPVLSTDGCPASAVIDAVRMARTPLAIAEGGAPSARLLFANHAFAALLGCDSALLKGRSLDSLARPSMPASASVEAVHTVRIDVPVPDGRSFPAALSVAEVPGSDGRPVCALCSLIDARGDGAETAIARDAEMLAQVARAASEFMSEPTVAAGLGRLQDDGGTPSQRALSAVERAAVDIEGSRP